MNFHVSLFWSLRSTDLISFNFPNPGPFGGEVDESSRRDHDRTDRPFLFLFPRLSSRRGRLQVRRRCSHRRWHWSHSFRLDLEAYLVRRLVSSSSSSYLFVLDLTSSFSSNRYQQRKGNLGSLRRVEFIWICVSASSTTLRGRRMLTSLFRPRQRDTGSFGWFQNLLEEIEKSQTDREYSSPAM